MRKACISGIALLFLKEFAPAGESANVSPVSKNEELEIVLVTGEQPGPALWKVSSGSHDLWILG